MKPYIKPEVYSKIKNKIGGKKMTLIQPVRLSERVKPLIELKSKEEHLSKSVVIKQFVYDGLEEYALELCSKGRLSIGKVAEILDRSIYDIHEMAKEKGIILSVTEEQAEESGRMVDKILKDLKVAK